MSHLGANTQNVILYAKYYFQPIQMTNIVF